MQWVDARDYAVRWTTTTTQPRGLILGTSRDARLHDALAWVPTILFFAAVQLADAALYGIPDHIYKGLYRGRDLRQARIRDQFGPEAAARYETLLGLANAWRYDGTRPNRKARVSGVARS